ncbi:hypothetical protein [Thaumasiovibrio subtropicus]|uniref:hypothetical protein n=1 Tax=Thaumasiovibrio subtropicus TaxID=1891207 RepID=UPI000B356D32|nr:hypothetical protein [Thaumasiovibrio subtropicus]
MKKVIATTVMALGLFAAGAQASYTLEETQMFAGSDNFHAQVQNHRALQGENVHSADAVSLYSAEEVRTFATSGDFHQRVHAQRLQNGDVSDGVFAGALSLEETRQCGTASDVNVCVGRLAS